MVGQAFLQLRCCDLREFADRVTVGNGVEQVSWGRPVEFATDPGAYDEEAAA